MTTKLSKKEAADSLARHERKCSICRHPDREAIEESFREWDDAFDIAEDFGLKDTRTVYRHARATGLLERRRQNLRSMLDNILEHSLTSVTADSVLRAIRAYSCLDEYGRWTEPPSRVVFTAERPAPQQALRSPLEGAPAHRSLGEGGNLAADGPALLGPGPASALEATPPLAGDIPDSSTTDPALIAVSRLEIPLSD